MQVSGYCGLLLGSPVILYEIIAFVLPGLTKDERRFLGPIVLGSSLLFHAGIALHCIFVCSPNSCSLKILYQPCRRSSGIIVVYWSILSLYWCSCLALAYVFRWILFFYGRSCICCVEENFGQAIWLSVGFGNTALIGTSGSCFRLSNVRYVVVSAVVAATLQIHWLRYCFPYLSPGPKG